MTKNKIKAIVFDFGNVIINIDVERTSKAFAELTLKSEAKIKSLFAETEIYRKYESGFYSNEEFRDVVRQTLSYPLNDNEIDDAWNALLLDVPKKRILFLEKLKEKYPIYLLSNTNAIHIEKCAQYFKNEYDIQDFRKLFNHAYLSYEMGLWKPDSKIYEKVISDLDLKPEEILFLDDNQANIDSARKLGIQCVKIDPPVCFTQLIADLL